MNMKKINYLLNVFILALAVLVMCGATVPALQFKAQAINLGTAGNRDGKLHGTQLFDSHGYYAIGKDDLKVGTLVQFFGHDWWVVYLNELEKVATFWMADPYATSAFNPVSTAYNSIKTDGSNIWSNGYTKSIWNCQTPGDIADDVTLTSSKIRNFLVGEANTMINNKSYENYKDKVVAGYVQGSNESNDSAQKSIPYLSWAKDNITNYQVRKSVGDELIAHYSLSSEDVLWLPSISEIKDSWKLFDSVAQHDMLGWTDNTLANCAWLRTPAYLENPNETYGRSDFAMVVFSDKRDGNYVGSKQISQAAGVRPAIHLDIANIEAEYQEHVDGANNGWFNNDWLKALFIGVCVLGIVGVTLVIIAAIARNKRHAE